MSAPKYLKRDTVSGNVKEVIAIETGPAVEAVVATNAGGQIDPSLIPGTEVSTAIAGESISAGAFVYVKASDGKLYNAVWASGGNEAIGYVLASYSALDVATYYTGGQNTGLSGLTLGSRYYGDHTTAGAVTATVPTGAGVLAQLLGYAVTTTAIEVNIEDAIILAS